VRRIIYKLFVEGEPKAQPRPRKGKYGYFYNPDTTATWKETIQINFLVQRKPMITGPVILTATFFFHRATGLHGKIVPHTVKPDADNLIKAVKDCLTRIEVYKDDSQVFEEKTRKFWTPGKSGTEIMIEVEE
jgi:Holliday junction resolvase RusA-like endonuclease